MYQRRVGLGVNRSLIAVSLAYDEHGDMLITCVCDCATATEVRIEMMPSPDRPVGPVEFAFTCDGCQSSHWWLLESREEGRA